MAEEIIPRLFGGFLLTEKLSSDALGRVYRARKIGDRSAFYRLRIFDAPGLDTEPVLIAIEQNGAVHDFLKNPSVTREVDLDSVEGDAYLAYRESGGRTLQELLTASRTRPFPIPPEHALLIAEKIATGLDHAYNSMIDGERTLHGVVWPGFVEVSDEGEVRLTGFGIADGILASRRTPAIANLLFPYVAPEVRTSGRASKTGDVYSNAAILYATLTGEAPPLQGAAEAAAAARLFGGDEPLPREIVQLLRTALAASPEARYETAGALRRDLGKLLFSGGYSPSTFNLAFFLTNLFKSEIAAEQKLRAEESRMDAEKYPRPAVTARPPRLVATPRFGVPVAAVEEPPPKKSPLAGIAIGVLVAAAIVAGSIVLIRTGSRRAPPPVPAPRPVAPAPTPAPPAPAPTAGMSADEFKEEVARRLQEELKKIESDQQVARQKAAAQRAASLRPAPAAVPTSQIDAKPITVTSNIPGVGSASGPPTARPAPVPMPIGTTPAAPRPVALGEADRPPEILTVVKPDYPPAARRLRVGGTVILSVLVTEEGKVADVRVIRGAGGNTGLTQAAEAAVRRWTFRPATRGGKAVRAWFTVPIPFVP
jgi:protein TonB